MGCSRWLCVPILQTMLCNRNKHRIGPKEPVTPITIASSPRQVVAYDVATLPWGNGFRYFLQITDLFSKWVELAPMKNQTSLHSSWILRLNVDGSEIRNALQRWGIEKRRSSPLHRGDGQSERGIQTTKQTIRCIWKRGSSGRSNGLNCY